MTLIPRPSCKRRPDAPCRCLNPLSLHPVSLPAFGPIIFLRWSTGCFPTCSARRQDSLSPPPVSCKDRKRGRALARQGPAVGLCAPSGRRARAALWQLRPKAGPGVAGLCAVPTLPACCTGAGDFPMRSGAPR